MEIDWNNTHTWVVLVVDDEMDNLELIFDVLQYYGAKVTLADSGNQALDVLQKMTPNLIILDLGMPEMNGWQLRLKIRELDHCQTVPIMALSAHAMVGDRERVLSAGFDGYLAKPISVSTIINDIRSAILNKPPLSP